jgi:galactonate dehydratase
MAELLSLENGALKMATRRDLLKSLLAFPMAARAARTTVTGIEVFHVKVNRRGNWIIVRMQTSAGVTGLGDASQSGNTPANDARLLTFLQQFAAALKGRSIYDVEYLRSIGMPEAERSRLPAVVAFSALEQCLWDIRGKIAGVPTFELFGGRIQPRIRQYANINRSTDPRTPEGFADMAARAIAAGFDAVKLAPFDEMPRDLSDAQVVEEYTKRGIACAEAVRKKIGPKVDLLIDVHDQVAVKRGLELALRLEPLNLYWLEEVVPPKPLDNLATINRQANMPTAGGELLLGVKGFYPYIKAEAVDIVMPDVKFCGGMLELKKIAAMAEGAGLQCAPHGPASPVGNVAAAHICATMPNFKILEFSFGEVPWRAELIDPPERIVDSALPLGDAPGFGITLNDRVARQHAL